MGDVPLFPSQDRRAWEDRRRHPAAVETPWVRLLTDWDYRCWVPSHGGDYRCWARIHPETRADALKRAAHAGLVAARLPDRPSLWTVEQIEFALDLAAAVARVAQSAAELAERRNARTLWTTTPKD